MPTHSTSFYLAASWIVFLMGGCQANARNHGASRPDFEEHDAETTPSILIVNARIFDGSTLISATELLIENGRITEVGTSIDRTRASSVFDAAGLTVLPGLIDAHTHTFEVEHLKQAARFGVTTELDMLGEPDTIRTLKETIASGIEGPLADLRSAGNGVLAPGGFGTDFWPNIETLDDAQLARGFVQDRIAEGSDYIKLLQDDGSTWGLNWTRLNPEVVGPVIEAAHESGLLAVLHAPSPTDVALALNFGIDGLIALYAGGVNPDLVRQFEERGAFLIPSMSFILELCGEPVGAELASDPQWGGRMSQDIESALRRTRRAPGVTCEEFRDALGELAQSEVRLLMGTDAPQNGVVHGASLHAELSLLVQAGYSPTAALHAATETPAEAFGLTDRGAIAPGLRADLLIVRGDPTQDIRKTRAIERVIVGGEVVPP